MHHLESLIQAIPPAVFAAGGTALSPSSSLDPDPSALFLQNYAYPAATPPPSLSMTPLMNPSNHFTLAANGSRQTTSQTDTFPFACRGVANGYTSASDSPSVETARMSLSSSYLYVDDEGFTRWQGETSGLPFLDLLIERHHPPPRAERDSSPLREWSNDFSSSSDSTWFPDRTTHHRAGLNPERIWKLVTSLIAPDLMDRYVYLVHPSHYNTHLLMGKSCTVLFVDIVLSNAFPSRSHIPQRTYNQAYVSVFLTLF
jgi:hypothetical protein